MCRQRQTGAICICVHVQFLPGRLVYACVLAKVTTDTVYSSDTNRSRHNVGSCSCYFAVLPSNVPIL